MILGIGGVSRGGKSKLARKVRKLLRDQGFSVQLLAQDDYVLPEENLPMIRDHIDWEVPGSIDWERWHQAIRTASENADWVIAEGLMVFWSMPGAVKFDREILVEIPEEVFFSRKQEDLRWGREPDWYIRHIWDSYLLYGRPEKIEGMLLSGLEKPDTNAIRHYLLEEKLEF